MLYINKENQIYSGDCLDNYRQLSEEEEALYLRGYGYEIVNGIIQDISQTDEYLAEELAKAKEAKLQENATKRDEFLIAGVVHKDVLFDSDTDQKVNILSALSVMGDTDTITWYGMNNEALLCGKSDLVAIGEVIKGLTAYVWAYKNPEFVEAISNAETLAELEAIEIDYNSAKIFGIQ